MTTTIQQSLDTLATGLKAGETAVVSAAGGLVGQVIMTLGLDQMKILGDALEAMMAARNSGSTWEVSLTVGYNTLSAEEKVEWQTFMSRVLSILQQLAQVAESAFESAATVVS